MCGVWKKMTMRSWTGPLGSPKSQALLKNKSRVDLLQERFLTPRTICFSLKCPKLRTATHSGGPSSPLLSASRALGNDPELANSSPNSSLFHFAQFFISLENPNDEVPLRLREKRQVYRLHRHHRSFLSPSGLDLPNLENVYIEKYRGKNKS